MGESVLWCHSWHLNFRSPAQRILGETTFRQITEVLRSGVGRVCPPAGRAPRRHDQASIRWHQASNLDDLPSQKLPTKSASAFLQFSALGPRSSSRSKECLRPTTQWRTKPVACGSYDARGKSISLLRGHSSKVNGLFRSLLDRSKRSSHCTRAATGGCEIRAEVQKSLATPAVVP